MKKIIVPVNFSASSVNAAEYAAGMALAINADLYLLYILQLPISISEVVLTEEFFDQMTKDSEYELEKLKNSLVQQTGGYVNIFTSLKTGRVEYELEAYCKLQNPFVVIMGINKNATERLMFGSNTFPALKNLQFPVMVVPGTSTFHAIRKILIACDFNGSNKNIPVDYLKEFQHFFNATFDVLNVNTTNGESTKTNHGFVSLHKTLHDLFPAYHFSIAKTVEKGINDFIDKNHTDLLLILPGEHRFFEFHTSETKKMALNASIPMLAIHE